MKIAKIILLALTTCLTSCYEDYTHDYGTTKLLQKSEMRKVIVIELSYKGFS